MADDNTVEISLVADDQASEALKRISEQLEEVAKSREKAGGEKEGGWAEAFKIATAIEGVKKLREETEDFVKEITKAGAEQDKVIRSITGVLAITDRTGQSYDSLLVKGGLFEEKIHDIGIESGVAGDKLVGAFNLIMERSGKSAEEASELTKKMAFASAAIPGGVDALATGFAQMEAGFISARNPIAQLVSSTGTLKGNAREVARHMQTLTSEERSKVAVEAITKMSEKMEKAAPSIEALMTSLHLFKEGIYEDFGKGLIKEITPKLAELTKSLMKYKDQITYDVEEGGEFLGKEFDKIWDGGKRAFKTLTADGATIGDNLKDAADVIVEAFTQAVEWSADIAETLSFGLDKASDKIAGTVATVVDWFKGGESYRQGTAEQIIKIAGEKSHLQEAILFGSTDVARQKWERIAKEHPEEAAWAQRAGMSPATMRVDLEKQAEAALRAAGVATGGTEISGYASTQFSEAQKNMASSTQEEGRVDAAQQFADAWDKAAKVTDETQRRMVEEWGAMMVLKNQDFAAALAGVGDKAKLDWTSILHTMQSIVNVGGASPEELEAVKKALRTAPGTKGAGPTFNIGHMTINQDFRDQDPDRVAIVFQKDLAKAAMNRTQAMLSSAFGP